MSEQKKPTDWERVEADYRAGILSLREIGAAHGVSHVAIAKRAKRDGWTRDLAAKIKAKADALVTKDAVTRVVSTEETVTERLIVDSNAQAVAAVRIAHRSDIRQARNLVAALLAELEALSAERLTVLSIEEYLRILENPGKDEGLEKQLQKGREALNKAISLPSRSGSVKALADSLRTLVTLERQAWGLADDGEADPETPSGPITPDESAAAYMRKRG